MKRIEMVGQKFGRLNVLSRAETKYGTRAFYLCECECGTKKVVSGYHLRKGLVTSCGCYNKEIVSRMRSQLKKHGMSYHKLYSVWSGMRGRCSNENDPAYNRYGGRGIKVCDEWSENKNFFRWATENGYKEGLSLDRINVDGDYSPENCRWVDMKVQGNNRRNTRFVEYEGARYTLSDFADKYLTINKDTFYSRLASGMTVEDSMNEHKRTNQFK